MHKRFLIVLLLLMLAFPALAQDDETETAPELTPEQVQQVLEVQGAYERLQLQRSYRVQGGVVGAQELTVEGGAAYFNTIVLDFTWDFVVNPRRDALNNVQGQTDLVFNLEDSEGPRGVEASYQTAIVDGTSFTNVSSGVTGVELNTWMQDPPIDANAPIPPDKSATETFLYYYLVSEETVTSITRLDDITSVDGQAMKVFEVTLSVPALQAANVMTTTSIGEGSSANLSASLNGLGAISQDATYIMTVTIGQDDNLPHEVEYVYLNVLNAEQRDGYAEQDVEGAVTYSEFGADVTITNPLEGDESAIDVELVTFVQEAYENLRSTRGYRITGDAAGSQTQIVPEQSYTGTFDLSAEYSGSVVPQSDGLDRVQTNSEISATLTENDEVRQQLDVAYDFILAEDQSWTNIRRGEGLTLDVWQGPNPTSTSPIPTDRVYSESFLFYYLLEPGTVTAISELPAEEIDGVAVRVFDVSMKIGVLRTQGVISLTGIGEGTDNNLSATFDGMGAITADTSYTMRIYVGERDQLPRRAEFEFDNSITTQTEATGQQNVSGEVNFFDFNDNTISIEPPI